MDAKLKVDMVKLGIDIGNIVWTLTQAPGQLREKYRFMQITIHNKSQFDLRWKGDSYFESGRFWQAPTDVPKISAATFSVCSSDNSIATGVSGGLLFEIIAPGKAQRMLGVGFSNPAAGTIKGKVMFSASAKQAYEDASTQNTSAEYEFDAEDPQGHKGIVTLRFVFTASTEAALTISQEFTLRN